ncbi:MAG: hypothetical protein ACREMQ_05130, partial [Longimicrobiales bacterium]
MKAEQMRQQIARWLSWFCLFFATMFLGLYLVGWGPAYAPGVATVSLCTALITGSLATLLAQHTPRLSLALLV